jgi:hypothetical protein
LELLVLPHMGVPQSSVRSMRARRHRKVGGNACICRGVPMGCPKVNLYLFLSSSRRKFPGINWHRRINIYQPPLT